MKGDAWWKWSKTIGMFLLTVSFFVLLGLNGRHWKKSFMNRYRPLPSRPIGSNFIANRVLNWDASNVIISPHTLVQCLHRNRIQTLKKIPQDYLAWLANNKTLQVKNTQGCHHLMTVADMGRLGNQMCQYVTLLGAAQRFGFQAVITEEMRSKLRGTFPYISLISMSQTKCEHSSWTNVSLGTLKTIPSRAALFDRGRNIRISGYP
eukprot:maker-scaffold1594_size34523-snap-gene-0.8 protein:Tk01744 transcript:maker-scaffold1594_size34523-snap-gene-0.8-mRNA-1 annotation:"galactoside 2-alpha-l-fucosyltransferase 2-like"